MTSTKMTTPMTSMRSALIVVMIVTVTVRARSMTSSSPIVSTRDGSLKGIRTMVSGSGSNPHHYVDVFYNIPFAKPPLGHLRFSKPVAHGQWPGVREAVSPGNMCPQQPFFVMFSNSIFYGNEDCLNLNVYTPQVVNSSGPYPVMVFIHGGGYVFGAGNTYDGTELAAKGVVVVTVNYRLGALGFLSTQDSASVGNYGLWDMILALEWVRDVISTFNGDPQDVTIFGESAGSGAVSLLIESKEARGLFHKAIMESGVSLCPWAVGYTTSLPNPRQEANDLASRLGCDVSDSSLLIGCLKGKDPRAIVETTSLMGDGFGMAFRPVPETSFGQQGILSDTPDVILRHGWLNNVTVLRGFNKDEGAAGLDATDPEDDGFTMEEFQNMTRTVIESLVVPVYPSLKADRIMELVMETYVTRPGHSDPLKLRSAYIEMSTDFSSVAPTMKETKLFDEATGRPQFLYRFSFRSANRLNQPWQGVIHADDLAYVFGAPMTNRMPLGFSHFVSKWTDDDIMMSQRIMTWWTNFAKYGNPTPDGSGLTQWLPWKQTTPRYLDLGLQATTTMINASDTPGRHLWNDVIPSLTQNAGTDVIG